MFAIPSVAPGWKPESPPIISITTLSLVPVNVNMRVIRTDFERNTTVTRYRRASIKLPTSFRLTTSGKSNTTVRVLSSGVTSIHFIGKEYSGEDGFLVLPITQLGKQYYAVTYKTYRHDLPSFVCVSALDQETSVAITTKAGRNVQIILAPYESYRFDGIDLEDLTGTFIDGSNPITVISGGFASVPEDFMSPDGLCSLMIPINFWKYSYVMSPFFGRSAGYIYRILSSNQTVKVNISSYGSVQIEANGWFEGDVTGDTVTSIEAERPVFVVQYMKSFYSDNKADPAMMVVPPVETFVNNVTFPVEYMTCCGGGTQYNIHVIINCMFANDLMFDDTQSMSNWPRLESYDRKMCAVKGSVRTGLHSVTHQDPEAKFTVAVYWFYDSTAYAYPAGYATDMGKSALSYIFP